ncbi:MAG: hypothetical protein F6J90_41905 [Moorea sp. SIOASIH]|uniref:hypothetical protein n=1 Tax=Moorena sp. SIOASIH TaxID=2607817 RepID=UPI0013BBF6E9|nr:hypothetical protein [Moorena sp. SIOASIH]NEO42526.1 hypothetical protein [Moorena sp. SIOASIH]
MGRWGDGDPPLTPPRRGIWGDGEMGRWGPTPNPSQEGNMGRWGGFLLRVIILTSYKPKYYVLNYTFLATDRIIKIFIWLI